MQSMQRTIAELSHCEHLTTKIALKNQQFQ